MYDDDCPHLFVELHTTTSRCLPHQLVNLHRFICSMCGRSAVLLENLVDAKL